MLPDKGNPYDRLADLQAEVNFLKQSFNQFVDRIGRQGPWRQMRLAKTVAGPDPYPTEPANVFWIVLLDGAYDETPGQQTPTLTNRSSTPHYKCFSLLGFLEENTVVEVANINGQFWAIGKGHATIPVVHHNCYTNHDDLTITQTNELNLGEGLKVARAPGVEDDTNPQKALITSKVGVAKVATAATGAFTGSDYFNNFQMGKGVVLQTTSEGTQHDYGCATIIVSTWPLNISHYSCYSNSIDLTIDIRDLSDLQFGRGFKATQFNEDTGLSLESKVGVKMSVVTADGSFSSTSTPNFSFVNNFIFGKGFKAQQATDSSLVDYGCECLLLSVDGTVKATHYNCYTAATDVTVDSAGELSFRDGIKITDAGSGVVQVSAKLGVDKSSDDADGSGTAGYYNNLVFGAGLLVKTGATALHDYGCPAMLVSTDGKVLVDVGDTRDYMGSQFQDTAAYSSLSMVLCKQSVVTHQVRLAADMSTIAGYSAGSPQFLKNDTGTLRWVDPSTTSVYVSQYDCYTDAEGTPFSVTKITFADGLRVFNVSGAARVVAAFGVEMVSGDDGDADVGSAITPAYFHNVLVGNGLVAATATSTLHDYGCTSALISMKYIELADWDFYTNVKHTSVDLREQSQILFNDGFQFTQTDAAHLVVKSQLAVRYVNASSGIPPIAEPDGYNKYVNGIEFGRGFELANNDLADASSMAYGKAGISVYTDGKCKVNDHDDHAYLEDQLRDGHVQASAQYSAGQDLLVEVDTVDVSGDKKLRFYVDTSDISGFNGSDAQIFVCDAGTLKLKSPANPTSPTVLASGTSETANSDTWTAGSTGVQYTPFRAVYNASGDKKLYGFTRTVTADKYGNLYSVSAETRSTIDTPDSC